MPIFIIEIVKVFVSVVIVGSLGLLSFLGIAEPKQTPPLDETTMQRTQKEIRPIRPETPQKQDEIKPSISETLPANNEEIESKIPQDNISFEEKEVVESVPQEKITDITTPQSEPTPEPESEPLEFVTQPIIEPSFADINQQTRNALVNILCTTKAGGPFRPITGSGIIIDERGVIVTNAHVAQFMLLKDYPLPNSLACVIRTGSPAHSAYNADLLYISPQWVENNSNKILEENPTGTGEDDYAFLFITTPLDPKKELPSTFSFLEQTIEDENINQNNEVLLAGYPAGFLGGITIQKDLYIVSTIGKIKELYTFKENTLDLISISGSIISQKGSSGGAVVSKDNKLLGIIVTATEAETTGERELRAITLAHINRSLIQNAGFDLAFLLFGDLKIKAGIFNLTTAPDLTKFLTTELDK